VPVEVRWGSASHVGCVRPTNQDAVLSGPVVFAVADGMGGHAGGEVASSITVAHLADLGASGAVAPTAVLESLQAANAEIRAVASTSDVLENMGTTVAGVALLPPGQPGEIMVFNVGDSRVYRLHDGSLDQVSDDHSVVAELLRANEISDEQAATHPDRHVVTRALGIDDVVATDVWYLEAVPGDRYLICSDGLTGEIDATEIGAVLASDGIVAQAAVDALLADALERRARDNVSAIVVEIAAVDRAGDADVDGAARISDDTNPREPVA
jgi:serine/threonine protein phosphatase PrpC